MTWDDIQDMTDDGLYDILYPKKFRRTTNYVPVDYAYVHSELKKTGVTMKLLWEEYRDRCVSEGREYCAYPTFTVVRQIKRGCFRQIKTVRQEAFGKHPVTLLSAYSAHWKKQQTTHAD